MEVNKNYWRNKDAIIASREEKEADLKYEIGMFRGTCQCLIQPSPSTFTRNLLWGSFAIHARVLIDFFYADLFFNDRQRKGELIDIIRTI